MPSALNVSGVVVVLPPSTKVNKGGSVASALYSGHTIWFMDVEESGWVLGFPLYKKFTGVGFQLRIRGVFTLDHDSPTASVPIKSGEVPAPNHSLTSEPCCAPNSNVDLPRLYTGIELCYR